MERIKAYVELVMVKFGDDKRIVVVGLVVVAAIVLIGVFA